jgi:hypothetical protein
MVTGFELAQGLHLVRGTFDVVDLAASTGCFAIALAGFRWRRNQPHENLEAQQ